MDSQFTVRACKAAGVVPATTSNSGQGKHRLGGDSLGYLRSTMVDEAEVEKSFWLSRPDGWVINRKTNKIILLEFKRTSDHRESYFKDMWGVSEKQHTPIMIGLRALTEEREWEVTVVPLVAGQRSVRGKEWLEALRTFGIGKEDG